MKLTYHSSRSRTADVLIRSGDLKQLDRAPRRMVIWPALVADIHDKGKSSLIPTLSMPSGCKPCFDASKS